MMAAAALHHTSRVALVISCNLNLKIFKHLEKFVRKLI